MMRLELELEGHTVQFLSVNMPSGLETQASLVEKCSYPLFQDLEEVDVWGLMNGAKDDFYIYDADGTLARYYAWGTEPALNLSTEEGYAALKDGILGVMAGAPRARRATDVIEDGGLQDAEGDAGDPGPEPDLDAEPEGEVLPGDEVPEDAGPEAG
jgi:hypothetical protein